MNERRLKIAWSLAEAASHVLETEGRDLVALRRALAMWRDAEIDAVFSQALSRERRSPTATSAKLVGGGGAFGSHLE